MTWLEAAAIIDEKWYGPLPDLILTQGRHLKPHPDTPIFDTDEADPHFVHKLTQELKLLVLQQKWRRHRYGEIADESPISWTPPEIRERFFSEQRRRVALLEAPTPSDYGSSHGEEDAGHIQLEKGGDFSTALAPCKMAEEPQLRPLEPFPTKSLLRKRCASSSPKALKRAGYQNSQSSSPKQRKRRRTSSSPLNALYTPPRT